MLQTRIFIGEAELPRSVQIEPRGALMIGPRMLGSKNGVGWALDSTAETSIRMAVTARETEKRAGRPDRDEYDIDVQLV